MNTTTNHQGAMPASIAEYLDAGGDPMALDSAGSIVEDIVERRRTAPTNARHFHSVILAAIDAGNYLSVVPPRSVEPTYPPADELAVMEQRDLWQSSTVLAMLDDSVLADRFEAALPVEVFAKHLGHAADYLVWQAAELRGENPED